MSSPHPGHVLLCFQFCTSCFIFCALILLSFQIHFLPLCVIPPVDYLPRPYVFHLCLVTSPPSVYLVSVFPLPCASSFLTLLLAFQPLLPPCI